MKLSQVLKDWPEKIIYLHEDESISDPLDIGDEDSENSCTNKGYNAALASCDREIDREALLKALWKFYWGVENCVEDSKRVSSFISTMPTWLKRIEK